MTWDALWERVNREAEQEYRFERDRYDFAMSHLWYPEETEWPKAALYAFGKEL